MTPREIVLEAVNHHETDILPYQLGIHAEIWEKLDAHYGGREHFPAHETFLAGHGADWKGNETLPNNRFRDRFGTLWVQGNIFAMVEPTLKEPSLAGYEFPDLIPDAAVPGIAAWCDAHADRFRYFNFGLTFFERAWALRGMENILMDMALEPAFCHALFERLMELHLEGMDKILHLPFESVRFGDDFGGQRGTLMGLTHWRTYLKPRLAKMYGKARDAGKIVSIHSCGDNSEILGEMIDMGLQIFNPAQPEANDLPRIKRDYGRHVTFEGGVGTQVTLPFGTPEQVREEIRQAREVLGKGGGYILTTTKPIRPEVPVANAVACVETLIAEARRGSPR